MTKTEMTEIFAAMSLAWPQAEMFRNGVSKLGPTIALWTACLEELDFWTAQRALVKLCRVCKFPPTIADLKEQADKVAQEIRAEISASWDSFRLCMHLDKTCEEAYARLPEGSRARKVIDAMGGPSALEVKKTANFGDGREQDYITLNWEGYCQTYERLLRRQSAGLPAATERRALTDE